MSMEKLPRIFLPSQNHTRFISRADALRAFEENYPRKFNSVFEWQDIWYQRFEQWLFEDSQSYWRDTIEILDLLVQARKAIYSHNESFKFHIVERIDKALARVEKEMEDLKSGEKKGGAK